MKKTHFERFFERMPNQLYIDAFKTIEEFDLQNEPLTETIVSTIFSPQYLATATNTPLSYKQSTNQRQTDITICNHMYHLWKDKNYFDVSPELCKLLLATDFKDIDTFFIRSPYRSMYLSLPKGNGIMLPGDQTEHELEGLYVLFFDLQKNHEIMMGPDQIKINDANKCFAVMAVGEEHGLFDDALIYFWLMFWDGKVSDSINKNQIHISSSNELWPSIRNIFTFLSKVLIYINCSNKVMTEVAGVNINDLISKKSNPAKIRKVLNRYQKLSTVPHKILESTINRHQQVISSSINISTGQKKGLEIVRPHFKVQHYGHQLSKHKVILVDTYLRGEGIEGYKKDLPKKIKII